ncbi:MAG: hypothetical protein DHS20C02_09360 [Micavibrio sp.]|nr:MAG: hypothetical protein DHS20C02_09360 [Micavibrio sp.]
MKRIFLLIILFVFISANSFAQEEELIGAGPKGRFTQEQANEIALRRVPGEILSSEGWWENDRFFVGVKILRGDSSIFEVEINTLTGKVHEIEIEYLAAKAMLPMDVIARHLAHAIALSHVEDKTRGGTKARVLKLETIVHERKPVYRVEVKRLVKTYEVLVNASSGKVMSLRKLD